jgi:hypothetical protein
MRKAFIKNHKSPYLPERENQGSKKPYRRVKNGDFAKRIELVGWLDIENEVSPRNGASKNNAEIS